MGPRTGDTSHPGKAREDTAGAHCITLVHRYGRPFWGSASRLHLIDATLITDARLHQI